MIQKFGNPSSSMQLLGAGIIFILLSQNFPVRATPEFWQSVLGDSYLEGPNPSGGLEGDDEFAKCALERHNFYRAEVGLTPFTWNKTIADIAFETATYFINEAECAEHHRMQFNEDHWLGENLWSFARYPTLMPGDLDMCKHAKDAVNSFYAEIELYTYPLGDEPFHKCSGLDKVSKFGHFVQMMFDKVTQIGCSYASCIGYDPAGLFQMPKIIVNCYYNEPTQKGASIFSEEVAQKLDEWDFNDKYGGLKNCSVD